MKKPFILIVLSLLLFSCKSENKNQEADLIRGEFIYIDDAAVIKGTDFIYGVELGELTDQLAKQIKPLQREEYDMVPVVIKGVIKDNPGEGWEEIVEIKEIIGVSEPTSELPTKVNSSEHNHSHGEGDNHEGHNH